ncbi:hypothetical protein ADUPG1_012346, partial [Aduncisulcus paluster]
MLPTELESELSYDGDEFDHDERSEEELDNPFHPSTQLPIISTLTQPIWSEAKAIEPKFVNEGGSSSIPIPRDSSSVIDPSYKYVNGEIHGIEKNDQSSRAQDMLKGKLFVELSYLSIPFREPSPLKGAYICLSPFSNAPTLLLFTFTDRDRKKTSKKYEFTERKDSYEWYFLPVEPEESIEIDLNNVVSCEIRGKRRGINVNFRIFSIESLAFVREETTTEVTLREEKETLWSETPTKTKYMKAGDFSFIPIPLDDPAVIKPPFKTVKGENDSYCKESTEYDVSLDAQKMLEGKGRLVWFTHLSIEFSSPGYIEGAYICLAKSHSCRFLLFTFTLSDETKIYKKYEFREPKRKKQSIKYEFPRLAVDCWFSLPIDLSDVVLCEIEGESEHSRPVFALSSLIFRREETSEQIIDRLSKQLMIKKMWTGASIIEPEFKFHGEDSSSPIPFFDHPDVINPSFDNIEGINNSFCTESDKYDRSVAARRIFQKGWGEQLSSLKIPFPNPSPLKGAYICTDLYRCPSSLLFTFTLSNGTKTSKKYEFRRPKYRYEWHFLPIDLMDVKSCEIRGKGNWKEKNRQLFEILSLIFFRGKSLLSDLPEFIQSFKLYEKIPIPSGAPIISPISFKSVKGTVCIESTEHDVTSDAKKMLEGKYEDIDQREELPPMKCIVSLSHLNITFRSPSPLKGVYISVNSEFDSLYLLLTFTFSDKKKVSKKYEISLSRCRKVGEFGLFFLPIDLCDVVSCEIRGKNNWNDENDLRFPIISLD